MDRFDHLLITSAIGRALAKVRGYCGKTLEDTAGDGGPQGLLLNKLD
jgi:hypothetical protein